MDQLIQAGLNHLQVSLNGSNEKVHSQSRDGFAEAVHVLGMLPGKGLPFGVNWVARKDNLDDFPAVIAYVKSLGADNLNVLRYKPSPAEKYARIALDRNEFYRLAAMIKQVRGLTVKTDSAYSNLLLYINQGRVSPNRCGCSAGRTFAAVTATGEFKPCSYFQMAHAAGSLGEYLKSRSLHSFLAEQVKSGDCSLCSYLSVCGGCRAICREAAGNMFAGENNCPAFKEKSYV